MAVSPPTLHPPLDVPDGTVGGSVADQLAPTSRGHATSSWSVSAGTEEPAEILTSHASLARPYQERGVTANRHPWKEPPPTGASSSAAGSFGIRERVDFGRGAFQPAGQQQQWRPLIARPAPWRYRDPPGPQ